MRTFSLPYREVPFEEEVRRCEQCGAALQYDDTVEDCFSTTDCPYAISDGDELEDPEALDFNDD